MTCIRVGRTEPLRLVRKHPMQILLPTLAAISLVTVGLALWRLRDQRADLVEMARLSAVQSCDPRGFHRDLVAGLPEPARRYFEYTIAPGTPLRTVAEISMTGRLGLGTREAPKYIEMSATETLAAPGGFVWKMRGRRGAMRISGSDSGRWTRFWILGLVPVAHLGGNSDHRRSAFGRYVAEAVFWTPAALLPGPGVSWEPVDDDRARVVVRHDDLEQSVELKVDAEGRPIEVSFPRWSDANPEKAYRIQPFGGYLSEFRDFGGFRLPTHVEAGNQFGTDDYFPFFIVDVTDVRLPSAAKTP